MVAREVGGEVRAVRVSARGLPFVGVAMDLGAREVGEPAGVIEVQVPEHDRVHVARPDTEPRQQHRQPILVVMSGGPNGNPPAP